MRLEKSFSISSTQIVSSHLHMCVTRAYSVEKEHRDARYVVTDIECALCFLLSTILYSSDVNFVQKLVKILILTLNWEKIV